MQGIDDGLSDVINTLHRVENRRKLRAYRRDFRCLRVDLSFKHAHTCRDFRVTTVRTPLTRIDHTVTLEGSITPTEKRAHNDTATNETVMSVASAIVLTM